MSRMQARASALPPPVARALATVLALAAAPVCFADESAPMHYPEGSTVFQANCAVCHGRAGAGQPGIAPPLTSYPARYAGSAEGRRQLVMTVLYGMFGDIVVDEKHYDFKMPDFARLGDSALAAVLNFAVFDLAHARAEIMPITERGLAAERGRPVEGEAVREHRASVVASFGP